MYNITCLLNRLTVALSSRWGQKCAAYNCRGNYNGEPYSPMVKFPSRDNENEKDDWDDWIKAMPNTPESLMKLKEVWICKKHFDPNCEWKTIKGGKLPSMPPSIFDGVPKSCLKNQLEGQHLPFQKYACKTKECVNKMVTI